MTRAGAPFLVENAAPRLPDAANSNTAAPAFFWTTAIVDADLREVEIWAVTPRTAFWVSSGKIGRPRWFHARAVPEGKFCER